MLIDSRIVHDGVGGHRRNMHVLARTARSNVLLTVAVAMLIALPGFASVKALLVIGYTIFAAATTRITRGGMIIALSVAAALLVSASIGLASGVPPYVDADQFARLAIFFGLFLCAARLNAFKTPEALDRLCLYSALIAALAKAVIMFLVVGLDIDFDVIQSWLGFETVTQLIGFNLQRLQFPADFVILFLVSCYTGGRSRLADALFLLSIAVVVMLSFSRFIFVCFFIGIFVRALWTRRFDFLPKIGLALVIVLALIFAESLAERFSGEGTDASDDLRTEQIDYLAREVDRAPWFGHGLGYAVPGYLRSETQPYSYEQQWYSTLMQLGSIGLAWFIASVTALVLRSARDLRAVLCVMMLLAAWGVSGFANPYLTSLGTALGFVLATWRAQSITVRRPRSGTR